MTPIQDGVEDFDLVFSHVLGGYGGLKEAKKPEVGIEIFEKNRHFTPF